MLVKPFFLLAVQRVGGVVARRVLDRNAREPNRNAAIRPMHAGYPLRCHQHLVPEPPIAGVDHHVTQGPGLFIDQEAFDMTDLAVRGMDVIAAQCLAAAQVRVLLRSRWRSAAAWAAASSSRNPERSAAPSTKPAAPTGVALLGSMA